MTEEITPPGTDTAPPASTPPATQPDFAIPDGYKDKPWAAKIKTPDDLWKQLDNTQALVGKKMVVPDWDKADPKEIDEYIGNLRPKDKTAYKFADDVPEEQRTAYADMLHDVGIPAYQANKLIEKYMGLEKAQSAKMYDKDGFMAELKASFGDGYEKTSGDTAKVLSAHLNEKDRAALEHIPNQFLGLIYRVAASMQKAYGASEGGAAGEGGAGGASVDQEANRKRIRGEITALDKKPHTAEDKQKLLDQLTATYKG